MELSNYVDELPRGGRKRLAIQLGISASYLSRLLAGDRSITAERALAIEEATGGAVTRFDVRPDLPWSVSRKQKPRESAQLAATMNQTIRRSSRSVQVVGSAV
ncbi:transcriptional regulator [Pseudomonas typographi]|uniref:Helix-turn-helix domain-containing protein n=1 Tax=Pseudomonas typographi TaxID=2715964 RepID=A0ABR7YZQ3_9PSED|nr:YdaS family helix-turn-helix protein [Pseudomonas typographi]MBD1586719.1 helix-turn-helix domain-containing protein [Pseudomonas typographi]MBD1598613.1 helix-turn-helix domain-containing protein [Pseudomonas typographi]